MTVVAVIGAEGFVGSAFAASLAGEEGVSVRPVTRRSYDALARQPCDVVIDCAGNSRKFWADEDPRAELEASVGLRLRTLLDFPAGCQLHVSSVDVYSDLTSAATTGEDAPIDVARTSHYGFHKLLAEQLVRHYAADWLIVRLAGMVGPGLRKNPVYDVLRGQPLRIHPDSRYQFLATRDAARIAWALLRRGLRRQVVNVCGDGLISPREIAQLAGRDPDLSLLRPEDRPRIVDVDIRRLRALMPVPSTRESVAAFLREAGAVSAGAAT